MPYIQVDGTQHSLRAGETPVGTTADAGIRLAGPDALGVQAVLTVARDWSVSIRRATPASVVKVNGVQLGAEPTPLIHGDKIEVAGREMLFGDEKKSGGTQMLSGLSFPELMGDDEVAPARPTSATGGRLVSLVDGREYAVPAEGLSLGRDAGCDVVVPGNDVSRRHANISAGESGYVLTDESTNGVFINGERVRKTQLLGRGDVLRIGQEEFRFYADLSAPTSATAPLPRMEEPKAEAPRPAAPAAPPPAAPPVSAPPPAAAAPPPAAPKPASAPPPAAASPPSAAPRPAAAQPPAPASGPAASAPARAATPPSAAAPGPSAGSAASPPASDAPAGSAAKAPAAPPSPPSAPPTPASPPAPAMRPLLATVEVTGEGVHKGKRFELRLPLVHVGRGSHNDIAVPDDSVSDTHAKLQKRDDGWYVVDMGSTNGTYVAGRRIGHEQRLDTECDLRFGGIKVRFRAAAEAGDDARGTRAIAGVNVAEARRAAAAAREPDPEVAAEKSRGVPMYVWVIALLLLGLAVFFILQGQAR